MFENKKLAVFGDSIMYGSGNDGEGVGEFLRDELGFRLLKYCVGGARTGYHEGKSWIVEQVKKAIADGIKPDYVVFDGFTNDCNMTDGVHCDVPFGEIGGNTDIFAVTKENTTFSNCFEVVAYALKKYFAGAKILFVRPHNMGRRGDAVQRQYGERAVEICKKYGIAVADIYSESGLNTFLPEHRDLYTADTYGWGRGDCTHPNALGYKQFYLPIIIEKLYQL